MPVPPDQPKSTIASPSVETVMKLQSTWRTVAGILVALIVAKLVWLFFGVSMVERGVFAGVLNVISASVLLAYVAYGILTVIVLHTLGKNMLMFLLWLIVGPFIPFVGLPSCLALYLILNGDLDATIRDQTSF